MRRGDSHKTGEIDLDLLAIVSRAVLTVVALLGLTAAAHQAATCCASLTAPRALAALAVGVAFGVTLLAIVLAAKRPVLTWLAAEIVLLGFVLVTVEVVVTAMKPQTWSENAAVRWIFVQRRAAEKLRVDLDGRTVSEVVAEMRARGVDALPGVGRGWANNDSVRHNLDPEFYPLSHASSATIVECNESGSFFIYETDEFGFNNPAGLVENRQIDIAVIGESHALGHCVPSGQSLVDLIRKNYPRTANFAMAESRSLSQLASFREYVEPLRPPVVLWFANPGYAEPGAEKDHPILARYLTQSFSQGLIGRQNEVDAVIRRWVLPLQEAVDRSISAEIARAHAERFDDFYTLPQIRRSLDVLSGWREGPVYAPDFGTFKKVLRVAQEAVARWDGVLILVAVPLYEEIVGEAPEVQRHRLVLEIASELGLHVVDGSPIFTEQTDPVQLFALRVSNHPTAVGHALLAERVIAELNRERRLRVALTPQR